MRLSSVVPFSSVCLNKIFHVPFHFVIVIVHFFRTELTQTQGELTEVKDLYVKVCQEKDQFEQDTETGEPTTHCMF